MSNITVTMPIEEYNALISSNLKKENVKLLQKIESLKKEMKAHSNNLRSYKRQHDYDCELIKQYKDSEFGIRSKLETCQRDLKSWQKIASDYSNDLFVLKQKLKNAATNL